MAKDWLGVSLKTSEKYVAELVDAGCLHKIAYLGLKGKFIHRYKLTEAKIPVNEPRKHTFIRDYHRQACHTRNQPDGFVKPRHGVITNAPRASRPALRFPEKPAETTTKEALRESARARVRASYFGPPPCGKSYRANKVTKKKILLTEESKPLTPFAKGDESSSDCRVMEEAKPGSTPSPETAGAKKAAARRPSKSSITAAFDARRPESPMASPEALEPVRLPDAAEDASWAATWGVRASQAVTPQDVEAFVAHPVTAMLQLVLGYPHWTYRTAYRWARVAARGLSAWEVLDFYRAFAEDFNEGVLPGGSWAERVRELLINGDWDSVKAPRGCAAEDDEFSLAPTFRSYAVCRQQAIAISGDLPARPEDLEAYYAHCADRVRLEAEEFARRAAVPSVPAVRFVDGYPEFIDRRRPPQVDTTLNPSADYAAFRESLAEFGVDEGELVEDFILKLNA